MTDKLSCAVAFTLLVSTVHADPLRVPSELPRRQPPRAVNKADLAENFSAPTANGHVFELYDYKHDYVVLDLMAAWCEPCLREAATPPAILRAVKGRGLTNVRYVVGLIEGASHLPSTQLEAQLLAATYGLDEDDEARPIILHEEGETGALMRQLVAYDGDERSFPTYVLFAPSPGGLVVKQVVKGSLTATNLSNAILQVARDQGEAVGGSVEELFPQGEPGPLGATTFVDPTYAATYYPRNDVAVEEGMTYMDFYDFEATPVQGTMFTRTDQYIDGLERAKDGSFRLTGVVQGFMAGIRYTEPEPAPWFGFYDDGSVFRARLSLGTSSAPVTFPFGAQQAALHAFATGDDAADVTLSRGPFQSSARDAIVEVKVAIAGGDVFLVGAAAPFVKELRTSGLVILSQLMPTAKGNGLSQLTMALAALDATRDAAGPRAACKHLDRYLAGLPATAPERPVAAGVRADLQARYRVCD